MNPRLTWALVAAGAVVIAAAALGFLFDQLATFLLAGFGLAMVVLVGAGRMRRRGDGRPSQRVDDGSWDSGREE
jgi:hypothetical protein